MHTLDGATRFKRCKRSCRFLYRKHGFFGLIIPSLLLISFVAFGARYQKKEISVNPVEQSYRTQVKPQDEKKDERMGPSLDAETLRAAAQANVAKLTDAAIEKLKQLIKVTDDNDPEKPDFYFRLAEHYREKKVHKMFQARELDDPIFQEQDPARKERLKSNQKGFENQERDMMLEAIKMYLHIATTKQFEQFKRMDEVLFNVADMLNQAKRRDRALEFFRRLIKDFPQSKYIPDAYLSFAEHYFNENEIEKALQLYEKVANYKDSAVYGYAIYKQGWCWINLKDYKKALSLFVEVIKNADSWAGNKKGKIVLIKEAKKDSVRAYSHVGEPDKAWNFFQRIGGSYAMTMLERLAELYYDQGKFLDAILIYKQLISLNPQDKKICNWQYAIVRCTLGGKDKREQVVELQRLSSVYNTLKGVKDVKSSAVNECRDNTKALLRELATTWHREAQKTQNNDTYALAQYLYKEYLDAFPKEKDTYVMGFYYADLLFKIEKWEDSAHAFTKVVDMNPSGEMVKDAAYAAVIAWKNALNVEEEVKDTEKVAPGQKNAPMPIPEKQQKMIAAFDTYIKHVPKSEELVPIKYRKARIYYEHNHFDQATTMFSDIVTNHPDHELAVFSANLLMDCLNILEKFDDLEQWLTRFLATEGLMKDEEFRGQCEKLKGQLERKKCDQIHKAQNFKQCGMCYGEVANKYPDAPDWSEMVYNAAICYEAAKLIGVAITTRKKLIEFKPDDPLAKKALYQVGANYHALSMFSDAAEFYEKYAEKYGGEEEAPDALNNAIVFRLGAGDTKRATDDVKLFEKSYGRQKKHSMRAAATNFALGAIYEQRNDQDGLIKHYLDYLKTWGTQGGIDRQILANVKVGETYWQQSCPVKSINGACVKIERVKAKRNVGQKKKKGLELKTQCGPETKMKVTVIDRNKTKAQQALKHFATALALYRKKGTQSVAGADKEEIERREVEMMFAVGAARFYQAEAILEDFLDVEFPDGLDFSDNDKKKKAASEKAFKKYLDTKGKLLEKARGAYEEVITLRVAHWAIAASARVGQLFQNFADALYTASVPKPPIPKQLTTREQKEEFMQLFTDTYCEKLEEQASPLERKAIEGLETCLTKSTELSWYNEWSTLCEGELNQIKPADYPIASEIRAEPGYISLEPSQSPVIQDLN